MPSTEENENENLPATQEAALPALELNHLPARQLAADNVTDALPAIVYQNIGALAATLTPEQEAILDEPTPDDEVDIRPDGLVYASHEYYRRKLNKVFGRFGWTLIPGSPLKNRLDKSASDRSEWYQRWILFVNGIYVSEAIASRTLYENNRQMTLDDVAEAIKSDALKRCCKDLGIAQECWQRRWTKAWRDKFAIQVVVQGRNGNEQQWRRRDADPLPKEIQARPSGSAQPQTAPNRNPTPADRAKTQEASSGSRERPAGIAEGAALPSASKSGVAVEGAGQDVKKAPTADTGTGGAAATPTPPASGAGRNAPVISQQQANLILALARKGGLIVGDDPAGLVALLDRTLSETTSKAGETQMEYCVNNLRRVQMRQFQALLNEVKKAGATDEQAERI